MDDGGELEWLRCRDASMNWSFREGVCAATNHGVWRLIIIIWCYVTRK